MSKLTETDKLKYWLDAEFSILHVMFAVIMLQLVTSTWQRVGLVVYIIFSIVYAWVRLIYISGHEPSYLRIPKK